VGWLDPRVVRAAAVSPRFRIDSLESHHGFFATTFRFSHTQIGVPYIRAVFLAPFAMRRRARPTPAAKLSGFFERVVAFTALAPVVVAIDLSYRKWPRNPPTADRSIESAWWQFWLFTLYDKNELSDISKKDRATLESLLKIELQMRK
jgi:hypothetical protein